MGAHHEVGHSHEEQEDAGRYLHVGSRTVSEVVRAVRRGALTYKAFICLVYCLFFWHLAVAFFRRVFCIFFVRKACVPFPELLFICSFADLNPI